MRMTVGTAALRWDVRPLAYGSEATGREAWMAAASEPELPVLVVLDSRMSGGPWSRAIARASQTVQVHGIARRLGDPATRAAFAYARDFIKVRRIVLGREGPGELAGPERGEFLEDLCALADELDLPVDGVWYASTTRQLFVVTAANPAFPERTTTVDPLVAALFELPAMCNP